MRNFLVQIPKQFLTDNFSHNLTFGLVCSQILIEKERGVYCILFTDIHQILNSVTCLCGNRNDCVKNTGLRVQGNYFQQAFFLYSVNFVNCKDRRTLTALDLFNQTFLLRTNGSDGFHYQNRCIHIRNGFTSNIHHIVAKLGTGAVITGGIHKNKLGIFPGYDTTNTVSCSLRFIGNDCNLLTNEVICQCGLADIGASGNCDHRCLCIHMYTLLI